MTNVRKRGCPHRIGFAGGLLLTALVGAGCGGGPADNRPATVPVEGTVLYNQKPVEGARIVFHPEGHQHAAAAQTNRDGQFQLQTFAPRDGAVPGRYLVTIRKTEVQSGETLEDGAEDGSAEIEERSLLPGRYSDKQMSGLHATVEEGGNHELTFELTD